jgi:hypothetical protein
MLHEKFFITPIIHSSIEMIYALIVNSFDEFVALFGYQTFHLNTLFPPQETVTIIFSLYQAENWHFCLVDSVFLAFYYEGTGGRHGLRKPQNFPCHRLQRKQNFKKYQRT